MSDASKIEWCNSTWNPVRGCSIISKGCTNCYAMKQAHRFSGTGKAYEGLTQMTRGGPVWTGKVRLVPELLYEPMHWTKPRRIFVNSMSDLFHDDVPDGFIMRVWQTMGRCQQHTFQILTKRPARMLAWMRRWSDLTGEDFSGFKNARGPAATRAAHPSGRGQMFADMLDSMGKPPAGCGYPTFDWAEGMQRWPDILPNVWLGVSCEDQATADERIPLLLQTPAAVRWISAEPLLGPIDLAQTMANPIFDMQGWLNWVVAGGESGPKARLSDPTWFRSLRDQCANLGVAFFFKQWGEWAPPVPEGDVPPGACEGRMYRVGKRAAGRLLDGREHNEYPA